MPRKTIGPVISKKSSTPSEELMDFDQFVTQKTSTLKKPKFKRTWLMVALVLIIVILAGILWLSLRNNASTRTLPYKVIYLDNSQYYYAKLVREDANYIYLDDVFYVQSQEQTVPAEKEGDEPQVVNIPILVHRGQEVHQPTGLLQISRDRVVAIEEIGANSDVYKEIMRVKAQP